MVQDIKVVHSEERPISYKERRRVRWNSRLGKYQVRKSRLYVWPEDWNAMDDFVSNRYASPVKAFRKALPDIFRSLGLPEDTKAQWSQYAGCSCPCSPGFILEVRTGSDFAAIVKPFDYDADKVAIRRSQVLGTA